MVSKIVLDLKGVVSPLDLLKCNSCLTSMKTGDILEVTLADAEVAGDLTTIVDRSNDEMLYRKTTPDGICIGIIKGPRTYGGHRK